MRLFIGVELDDHVRTAAAAIAESLKRGLGRAVEARWIGSANLHITLWFLGEVEESRVEPVIRALDTPFRETAFDLEITGAGVFPATGAPRVIWLGLTSGADALRRLHTELATRLPSLGFEPERRAYSAHLTIARIKEVPRSGSYREIRDVIHNQPAHAGRCRIEAVTLFRSRLSPKGASYEAILRVPLE
jgi:RNA 2',3'-cyclic 3'-phosphodiesterase